MKPNDTTSTACANFEANAEGRDFAVGDIHGSFGALQAGLDLIGFDPQVDRLFSVGDLVDRGPESNQVLTWLDKPWFHAIAGNHDFMTWRSARGKPYEKVDHASHGGAWLGALSPVDRKEIGERLAALPFVAEIVTPAFVTLLALPLSLPMPTPTPLTPNLPACVPVCLCACVPVCLRPY